MGILNLTPDSFSDGGLYSGEDAVRHALQMEKDGADILDIGAESTRPGAPEIDAPEQLRRILPVLKEIRRQVRIPVSIDTTLPEVAAVCLSEGAEIINDVSGLRASGGKLAETAASHQAGLILMHRRGNSETMQKLAVYEDLMAEVTDELIQSRDMALERGAAKDSIVLDPGLGFSKTPEQNLVLMKELKHFAAIGSPLMLGPSRKSFIGKATGREVHEREFGTAACIAQGFFSGIRFFRVHDVKAARDVLNMLEAIQNSEFKSNARLGCL